jgi:Na+/H+ antiporter NhaA
VESRTHRWIPEAVVDVLADVLRLEVAAGATILAGVVAALLWAGLDASGYDAFWNAAVEPSLFRAGALATRRDLVTSLAMTVFFLAIGLEISRERTVGSLRDRSNAILPIAAALGGMAGAAMVYAIVAAAGDPSVARAWGVPMATDVAFTLGVLALLGRRVPSSLRVLLLTIAVADDVASVVVLAVVSGRTPSFAWLAAALAILAIAGVCASRKVPSIALWVVLCVALWCAFAAAGVEPPLAGAFVGALVPAGTARTPGVRIERVANPVSTWLVLPAFALATCGISFATSLNAPGASVIIGGIVAARTVGKVVGILGGIAIARGLGVHLPDELRHADLVGGALLCGIGLTVPLLFAGNAFGLGSPRFQSSLLGLFAASVVAAGLGLGVLRWALWRPPRTR